MQIEKVNANCKWEKIEKKNSKPKPQNPAAWSADTWKIFCPGSYYEPGRKLFAPGLLSTATWTAFLPGS